LGFFTVFPLAYEFVDLDFLQNRFNLSKKTTSVMSIITAGLISFVIVTIFIAIGNSIFVEEPAVSESSIKSNNSRPSKTSNNDWAADLDEVPDTTEITGPLSKKSYWTPSGKSYHFSSNCTTLKRSSNILSGTLKEAISEGKKDPCNLCADGS
jgi:hypothetical protein